MKVNISKETLKTVGDASLRIGKRVLIEGSKAVILKGAVTTLEASFDKGVDGVKGLTLGKLLGEDKAAKKKGLFKRKEKVEHTIEELIEEEIEIEQQISDIVEEEREEKSEKGK